MTKKTKRMPGLKALNDIYIIEEDPLDWYSETDSNLSKDVVDALKGGLLYVPEAHEDFAKKFPCTGRIVSVGERTKYKLPVGTRVIFARLGVQRYTIDGKQYADVRECDLHGTLEDA